MENKNKRVVEEAPQPTPPDKRADKYSSNHVPVRWGSTFDLSSSAQ